MSPQNVLVDVDGTARVLDFGVAKAAGRTQTTGRGKIKGKLRYMAPEQIQGSVTRQSDVFATSVVLWEVLTGARLFPGDDPRQVIAKILNGDIDPPSRHAPHLPPAIDAVVMRGLQRDPLQRYATAREMAMDLESAVGLASPTQVGAWVESLAQNALAQRAATVAEIESSSSRVVDVAHLTQSDAEAVISGAPPALGTSMPPAYGVGNVRAANDSVRSMLQAPRWRRGRVPWALGGAGLLVACIAVLLGLHRSPPVASMAALSPSAAPSAIASEAPPPSSVASLPEPPLAASSAEAVPSAEVPAHRPPEAAVPARPATPRPVVVPARRPTVAVDCAPPYSLDAQGHKHWKDACFRKQGP